MQSDTVSPFSAWRQGIQAAIQLFLAQIKERILAKDTLHPPSLLISYVPDPNSPLDIASQARDLGCYFQSVGMQVNDIPLTDSNLLAQELKKHHFALILCTPAYAKKVQQDPTIHDCLDRFGQTQKNALYPLLCEGDFNDTALKIVDRHYLIRAYQGFLKPELESEPLRPLEAFIDIFLMLSGQQGLGILPAMLLKEVQQAGTEALYQEALDSLKSKQSQLTIDYRLSLALENDVQSHAFKAYLPKTLPVIQENQGSGFKPMLDHFLPSKAKISLLLCKTSADVQLSSLGLMEALQKKRIRVLSIDCARYAGHACKKAIRSAAQDLKLRNSEDLKSKPLVILLRGYEDLGAEDNLYVQNQLSAWPYLKVIVTCRADFFAQRGYLRCFLNEASDRRVKDLVVYKVPAFASIDAQKVTIPLILPEVAPTFNESLSPKRAAQQTELRAFLSQVKAAWVEQGWLSVVVAQNPQVFISYAWEKDPVSLKRQQEHLSCLAEDLRTLGFKPWFDKEQMTGNVPEQMERNIAQSAFAIVIGSPLYAHRSTTALDRGEKTNVQKEYETILSQEAKGNPSIFPLLFLGDNQNTAFPAELRNRPDYVDFRAIDEGAEYLKQMSDPRQGLIPKLLGIDSEPERLRRYQVCYMAFQKQLKFLVGKHLVVGVNQATIESLEVRQRLQSYLPPFALAKQDSPLSDRFDLGPRWKAFLQRSQAKTFVVLGCAGSGKSLFSLSVFQDLMQAWQFHRDAVGTRPQWLPLYIRLRDYQQHPESCIHKALREQFGLLELDIQALKAGLGHQQSLLFMCDGYDELGVGLRPNLSRQLEDWPHAKLLITARPEHFDTEHAVERCLAPSEGFLDFIHLSPFSEEEVRRFVFQHEQGQATKTYQTLQGLPSMMALVNNPFLLSLVLQSLPQLLRHRSTQKAVTRTEIYEAFVQTWFRQETEGRKLKIEDCQIFSEKLAFELFKANTLSPSFAYPSLWTFFKDESQAAVRDAAPIRSSGGQYMFLHASLYEYFASKYLWRTLKISTDSGRFSLLDTYPLLKQSGILDFLLEKLLEEAPKSWEAEIGTALGFSNLLCEIAAVEHELKKYDEVKAVYERLITIYERHFGPKHVMVAGALAHLGGVYNSLGDASKSKTLLERALPIYEQHYGRWHLMVAAALTDLGQTYHGLGDASKSKTLLERAFAIHERLQGSEHTFEMARTLSALGNTYSDLGDAIKSKTLLERVLSLQEHHYGTERYEVAITLSNLGKIYYDLGNAEQSKVVLERALKIKESLYGPEHFEIVPTLTNLGNTYVALGNERKAKELLERALSLQERHFDPEHPSISLTLTSLGNVCTSLDPARSKEVLERALKIKERYFGPEHPEIAPTLTNLANAYRSLGNVLKSKDLLERALSLHERHFGPKHPTMAIILTSLGSTYHELGNLDQSQTLLKRALCIREDYYGSAHVEVAIVVINLGATLESLGNEKESQACFKRAYDIFLKTYGMEHPHTQKALRGIQEKSPSKLLIFSGVAHQQVSTLNPSEIGLKLRRDSADPNVVADVSYGELVKRAIVLKVHLDQSSNGNTALHWALIKNQGEKAIILFKEIQESDQEATQLLEIKNNEGKTILAIFNALRAKLPNKIGKYIANILATKSQGLHVPLSEGSQSNRQELSQFLRFVAEGEQDRAEAMLRKHRDLVLFPGDVQDLSGRTFENITGFQYAVWALDWHMWMMLRRYLPDEQAATQIMSPGSWVRTHGLHAGMLGGPFDQLIKAYEKYSSNIEAWSKNKRYDLIQAQWCQQIGGAQLLLPAQAINEYCHPDRSFNPCPSFLEPTLPRTRKIDEGEWFTASYNHGKLGDGFGICRGVCKVAGCTDIPLWGPGGAAWMLQGPRSDYAALVSLAKIRTQQREQLASELSGIQQHTASLQAAEAPKVEEARVKKVEEDCKAVEAASKQSEINPANILMFKGPRANREELSQFLRFVAEGEQDRAEAMLQSNRDLVLSPGNVRDLSGRTFEGITGLQYAVWGLDRHMWAMLMNYLSFNEAASQLREAGSWVYTHGLHAGVVGGPLDKLQAALRAYMQDFSCSTWQKQVGGAQLLLPAHVINEYCRPDRSFFPCPDFQEVTLPRTRKIDGGEWFSAVYNGGKLGDKFACFRGMQMQHVEVAGGTGGGNLFEVLCVCFSDACAVEKLTKTRVQELDVLYTQLECDQQVSTRQRLGT